MVLYLVVGIGVAAAVYLSSKADSAAPIFFRMTMAIPFWPLYLPILLSAPRSPTDEPKSDPSRKSLTPEDDMHAAIAQVDAELEAALNSLDGWAEDVLARERDRIRELRDAWNTQANRVREMDRLLAVLTPTLAPAPTLTPILLDQSESRVRVGAGVRVRIAADPSLTKQHSEDSAKNRLMHSQQACEQNIERLRLVRQRTYEDLLSNLAWVRELVSMIHLAKFTGAPASRAEELVAQIATAVEGLSDLTWREESLPTADSQLPTEYN